MNPEKLQQLQLLEQNLQQITLQKQQFQAQLMENESALHEVRNTDVAYKIIGTIMLKANKADVEKELSSRTETAEVRLQQFERQESEIRKRIKELQEDVLEGVKKKKE